MYCSLGYHGGSRSGKCAVPFLSDEQPNPSQLFSTIAAMSSAASCGGGELWRLLPGKWTFVPFKQHWPWKDRQYWALSQSTTKCSVVMASYSEGWSLSLQKCCKTLSFGNHDVFTLDNAVLHSSFIQEYSTCQFKLNYSLRIVEFMPYHALYGILYCFLFVLVSLVSFRIWFKICIDSYVA